MIVTILSAACAVAGSDGGHLSVGLVLANGTQGEFSAVEAAHPQASIERFTTQECEQHLQYFRSQFAREVEAEVIKKETEAIRSVRVGYRCRQGHPLAGMYWETCFRQENRRVVTSHTFVELNGAIFHFRRD